MDTYQFGALLIPFHLMFEEDHEEIEVVW